jgi:hypothetical protein
MILFFIHYWHIREIAESGSTVNVYEGATLLKSGTATGGSGT